MTPRQPDILVAGPVTRDRIEPVNAPPVEQPGGTAFHAATTAARLGMAVHVLTRVAGVDRADLLDPLHALGVRTTVRPGHATTRMINRHTAEGREQRAPRLAPPLRSDDFDRLAATAIHLGPLTRGDLASGVLAAARERCTWLALDAQGLVRRVAAGRVRPCRADPAVLTAVGVLKASAAEARLFTGCREPQRAARRLHHVVGGEILVTLGAGGAVLAAGDGVQPVPALDPGPVVDTTGCGDAFLAGYLTARLDGDPPSRAALTATAAGALTATRHAGFAGDRATVRALVARSGMASSPHVRHAAAQGGAYDGKR